MKRGGLYALGYGPIYGPAEDAFVIVIHPEYETAVDHHTQVTQPPYGLTVVVTEILHLPLALKITDVCRFESDKETAQPACDSLFQQTRLQHRIDSAGSLPQAAHTQHAFEERGSKRPVAKQMIVQEIQVSAGQAPYLCKSGVDRLRIE
jgi:hypothetical protein